MAAKIEFVPPLFALFVNADDSAPFPFGCPGIRVAMSATSSDSVQQKMARPKIPKEIEAHHTDLASTIRYLRPARGEKVQAQVEALWATASSKQNCLRGLGFECCRLLLALLPVVVGGLT